MRQQTPAERAETDWPARKQQLIRELLSPATWNTDNTEADVISMEELNAALEDPDLGLVQRAQEQAERMQAQVLAREQAAAAAAIRRRVGQPPTTAQRHAHDQEQAAAHQQHRPQGPGRT